MTRSADERIADNILVHEYFGVDPAIVRDVIDSHLAPLASALRRFESDH